MRAGAREAQSNREQGQGRRGGAQPSGLHSCSHVRVDGIRQIWVEVLCGLDVELALAERAREVGVRRKLNDCTIALVCS
jgi:hypothetical protein